MLRKAGHHFAKNAFELGGGGADQRALYGIEVMVWRRPTEYRRDCWPCRTGTSPLLVASALKAAYDVTNAVEAVAAKENRRR
jgi:hypothetical protein